MSYIIMKKTGLFPRAWKKVCCIANLFPSNKYLYIIYKLKPDDIISVRHTRRSRSLFKWKGYRTKFLHVFNGTVKDFDKFSYEFCKEKRMRL